MDDRTGGTAAATLRAIAMLVVTMNEQTLSVMIRATRASMVARTERAVITTLPGVCRAMVAAL